MIEQLPLLVPDPARRDRTRARCHKKLVHRGRPHGHRPFVLDRALLIGLGAIYLSSLAFNVMRVVIW